MENKKLGITIILLTLLVGFILIRFINSLNQDAQEMGCFSNPGCVKIESTLNITHVSFGILGFFFALGVYLIIFSRGEEAIIRRLEEEKNKKLEEEKFSLILKALDPYERKVMNIVREQEGITQNTLRIKADFSKAKLSYVLQDLERKNLIKRVKKGKTLAIYLAQ